MSELGRLEHGLALRADVDDDDRPLGELKFLPRRRTNYERLVKPTLDRVLALVVLIVLAPLLAAAATLDVAVSRTVTDPWTSTSRSTTA